MSTQAEANMLSLGKSMENMSERFDSKISLMETRMNTLVVNLAARLDTLEKSEAKIESLEARLIASYDHFNKIGDKVNKCEHDLKKMSHEVQDLFTKEDRLNKDVFAMKNHPTDPLLIQLGKRVTQLEAENLMLKAEIKNINRPAAPKEEKKTGEFWNITNNIILDELTMWFVSLDLKQKGPHRFARKIMDKVVDLEISGDEHSYELASAEDCCSDWKLMREIHMGAGVTGEDLFGKMMTELGLVDESGKRVDRRMEVASRRHKIYMDNEKKQLEIAIMLRDRLKEMLDPSDKKEKDDDNPAIARLQIKKMGEKIEMAKKNHERSEMLQNAMDTVMKQDLGSMEAEMKAFRAELPDDMRKRGEEEDDKEIRGLVAAIRENLLYTVKGIRPNDSVSISIEASKKEIPSAKINLESVATEREVPFTSSATSSTASSSSSSKGLAS